MFRMGNAFLDSYQISYLNKLLNIPVPEFPHSEWEIVILEFHQVK